MIKYGTVYIKRQNRLKEPIKAVADDYNTIITDTYNTVKYNGDYTAVFKNLPLIEWGNIGDIKPNTKVSINSGNILICENYKIYRTLNIDFINIDKIKVEICDKEFKNIKNIILKQKDGVYYVCDD